MEKEQEQSRWNGYILTGALPVRRRSVTESLIPEQAGHSGPCSDGKASVAGAEGSQMELTLGGYTGEL